MNEYDFILFKLTIDTIGMISFYKSIPNYILYLDKF